MHCRVHLSVGIYLALCSFVWRDQFDSSSLSFSPTHYTHTYPSCSRQWARGNAGREGRQSQKRKAGLRMSKKKRIERQLLSCNIKNSSVMIVYTFSWTLYHLKCSSRQENLKTYQETEYKSIQAIWFCQVTLNKALNDSICYQIFIVFVLFKATPSCLYDGIS